LLENKPIRVLIAKPGLDGHDRGAKVVARGLMNAGMEVVFLGIRHTPSQIAQTALEEDVDVVGLSILSGAHGKISERVIQEMESRGIGDKIVIIGGVIPYKDIPMLTEKGVRKVFRPGTPIKEIAEYIQREIHARRQQGGTEKGNYGGAQP
jgi:methylmalonyl-CoA mutase C-terminal domain/subunit